MSGWQIAGVVVGVLVYGGFMFFLGAFIASAGWAGRMMDAVAAEEVRRQNEARAKLN